MHTPSKVLWIRFGAFGDVLQAIARARLFKRRFPDAKLTMLTRPEFAITVEPQDCFDDFIYWDSKHDPKGIIKCVKEIRSRKFDTLVSVHNAVSAALVTKLSGVPYRYGYKSIFEKFYYDQNVWEWFKSVGIDRDLRDTSMIQASDSAKKYAAQLLAPLPEKKLFCITGASKPQKLWPIEYWPQFIARMLDDGWGIVLNGHGDIEKAQNEKILSQLPGKTNIVNLTNKINYDDMCAVIQACTASMGNDTGPLHLSALAGTPTFGLFGCTPSQKIGFTMPWFGEVLCTCPKVGCFDYTCPLRCLETITVDMAYEGFKEFSSKLLAVSKNQLQKEVITSKGK